MSSVSSTSVSWKPPGRPDSDVNLSPICSVVSEATLSSASAYSSPSAACFRRLDDVLWNTDGTASLFRYLRVNFAPLANFLRRPGLLSWCSSTKSLSTKCNEHILEYLVGTKSFLDMARIHCSRNSSCRGNEWKVILTPDILCGRAAWLR